MSDTSASPYDGGAPKADLVIYHNPDCGTSRNTLALIRAAGIEPHVIEYLKTPPSRALLRQLISRSGLAVREIMRKKGTPFGELGLDDPALSDDALIDVMQAHPILINRPIVVSSRGVALCRPSDIVLDLLPQPPAADVLKEEGIPFLRDLPIAGNDQDLIAALQHADLPTDDLNDAGRTFFAYRTLGGTLVGYGGYEMAGTDVLIRSVVILPIGRRQGLGRNVVPLLLRRAYTDGARRAWALTESAAEFFTKVGFKATARDAAPAAILATRQAVELCPSSAQLLSRQITF